MHRLRRIFAVLLAFVLGAEEFHITGKHLKRGAMLAVLRGVAVHAYAALDCHLAAFGQIALAVIAELFPRANAEIISFIAFAAVDGNGERAHILAVLGGAQLRIAGEVTDDYDAVDKPLPLSLCLSIMCILQCSFESIKTRFSILLSLLMRLI